MVRLVEWWDLLIYHRVANITERRILLQLKKLYLQTLISIYYKFLTIKSIVTTLKFITLINIYNIRKTSNSKSRLEIRNLN